MASITTLMNLPIEIHLKIMWICVSSTPFEYSSRRLMAIVDTVAVASRIAIFDVVLYGSSLSSTNTSAS